MQEFENVWKLKKFDRQISAQLGEELSIATPIANILAGRGLKDAELILAHYEILFYFLIFDLFWHV
jgi:hypothetical protein